MSFPQESMANTSIDSDHWDWPTVSGLEMSCVDVCSEQAVSTKSKADM